MINKEVVILLDFKGNVTTTKLDARSRHGAYGEKLRELSKEKPLKFVVISGGSKSQSDFSDSVDFHEINCSHFKLFKFIFLAIRVIKMNSYSTKVIVCGDPWESFLLGKFVQAYLRVDSKLQLQVHADISDKKWRYASKRNWLRSISHKYAFNHCDQIRVVSITLQNYIRSISRNKNVVVFPVPIVIPDSLTSTPPEKDNILKIGFFGRLQKDRGTDDLIRIISKLNSHRQDFALYVAGKGSEENNLRKNLLKIVGENRSFFLGQLKQSVVWEELTQLDIYLSLAPSESYGLGIREAIIAGVPVIAVQSNGAREAQTQFGTEKVKLIDTEISGDSLSKIIDQVVDKGSVGISFQEFREQNFSLIDNLVESWIVLAHSNTTSFS